VKPNYLAAGAVSVVVVVVVVVTTGAGAGLLQAAKVKAKRAAIRAERIILNP
jgi:hypothetical protein